MTSKQKIPPNWVAAQVQDVVETIDYGHTASAKDSPEGPRFLRITDIQNGRVNWQTVPSCELTAEELDRYRLVDGDLVFARTGATTGKSFLIRNCPEHAVFASYLIRLRASAVLNPAFLAYCFQSPDYWRQISQTATGTAQPGVNATKLNELRLLLAPEEEQLRIVEAIESYFTRLDDAVTTLERVQRNLKRYRASVLKSAVEGRLVPTEAALAKQEGRDYELASVLLERILTERRRRWSESGKKGGYEEHVGLDMSNRRKLPEGWCWTTIGEISESLDRLRVPVNKSERLKQTGSIPYYGANGRVGWIDQPLFNEPLVLVVEDETFTGREKPFCYKITGPSWVNNHAHVLRSTEAVSIDYLNYSLMFYPFVPLTTGTTGRRKLTQGALLSAPYPLPPILEQHRIVSQLTPLLDSADETERVAARSLARLTKLRQSILKWAFEGKLADQDPNDEPASVLLERIKAERATPQPAKKKSRA